MTLAYPIIEKGREGCYESLCLRTTRSTPYQAQASDTCRVTRCYPPPANPTNNIWLPSAYMARDGAADSWCCVSEDTNNRRTRVEEGASQEALFAPARF